MKTKLPLKITTIFLCSILLFCAYQRKTTYKKPDLSEVVRLRNNPVCDTRIYEQKKQNKMSYIFFGKYVPSWASGGQETEMGLKFSCSYIGTSGDYDIKKITNFVRDNYPSKFIKPDDEGPRPGRISSKEKIPSRDAMSSLEEDILNNCNPTNCEVIAILTPNKSYKESPSNPEQIRLGSLYWDSRPYVFQNDDLSWFRAFGYCKKEGKRLPSLDEFKNYGEELLIELSYDDEESLKEFILSELRRLPWLKENENLLRYRNKNPYHVFWTSSEDESNKNEAWVFDLWSLDEDTEYQDKYGDNKNYKSQFKKEKQFFLNKNESGDSWNFQKSSYVMCVSDKEGVKK